MKKPTRRATVTTGAITVAIAALSATAALAMTPASSPTQLAGNRLAVSNSAPSPRSQGTPTGGRAGSPTVLPPTVPGTVSSSAPSMVIPPAPGPAPARQDAATVVPVANTNNGSSKSKSSSSKKTTTGGGGAAPAGGSSYPEHADIANALFSLLNQERASNGLAALGRNSQLNNSAHAHNVVMADTGVFSHQVTSAGEPSLGPRITAAGYHWTSAGENIAWGSYASVSFADQLETEMYNETPPDDGHRLNILSTSFHNVGVDVITDGSGKMWITFDFGS